MQERIRRARRRAGLSQAGLAELVNVQRSAVSNWESANGVLPNMQNLLAVAKACRVSLEWLGTGRGGISTDPDALDDVPAADAELVDVEEERDAAGRVPQSPAARPATHDRHGRSDAVGPAARGTAMTAHAAFGAVDAKKKTR